MPESIQHKLTRNRPPREPITIDVETGGAREKKELPFVVGVLGDFAGDSAEAQTPVKDRRFVEISRDNFDKVLDRMKPALNIHVDDKLSGEEDSEIGVELKFNSMEDFEPGRVAEQVPQLKALLELRQRLKELLSQIDRSPELETELEKTIQELESLAKAPSSDIESKSQPQSEESAEEN